ncbi:MAG: uracil-DNA glycosylase [Clostridia bacterium]|nr:uracil-DNA glycosylase [Clostridia bacterium]
MIRITKNWSTLLKNEFEKPYFKQLQAFLEDEYANFDIYPEMNNIFNALNTVKYEDVKVVIIGQDPYHEPNQAHGLAFSVQDGITVPPSLVNIYKEIESDLGIKCHTETGNLLRWAKQGVLLLNTSLTVRRAQANSHRGKGWETFTNEVIKLLSQREDPMVFILWGSNAQSFAPQIAKQHLVLKAPHPSPLSSYRGFFGCKHFSKTNDFLANHNKTPIDWQ